MSLVLGFTPKKQQTISADLKAKGVEKLKCTPSAIDITAAVSLNQVAFKEYTQYLPAFMSSCKRQAPTDVRQVGHPIEFSLAESFPFSYPDTCVSLTTVDTANEQALLDMGAQVRFIESSKVFVLRAPDGQTLAQVSKFPNISKVAQCADELANLQALETLRLTIRIFSGFYITHSYPAFRDPGHEHDIKLVSYLVEAEDKEMSKKRTRDTTDEDDVQRHNKARETADGKVLGIPEVTQTYKSTFTDKVVRIKTPPSRASAPWATKADELPKTWGIYSPYFADTQFHDTKMVPRVIRAFFLGCLHTSKTGMLDAIHRIDRDWGVLGKTLIGKQLTHMAFCINAGIHAQARPVPIFENGHYTGTIIAGYGFVLGWNDYRFFPQPSVEWLAEMDKFNTHMVVLQKVLAKAGFDMDPMGDGLQLLSDKTLTMEKLRKLLVSKSISEMAKQEVRELAKGLSFPQAYWGTNAGTLTQALHYIADHSEPLPDDIPVHPSKLFVTDRLEIVWSCFGFSAPTFRPEGGRHHKITDKKYTVEFTPRGTTEKKRLEKDFTSFQIRHIALDLAISDMKDLRDTQEVRFARTDRRSRFNEDHMIRGKDFSQVLGELMKFCGASRRNESANTAVAQAVAGPSAFESDEF